MRCCLFIKSLSLSISHASTFGQHGQSFHRVAMATAVSHTGTPSDLWKLSHSTSLFIPPSFYTSVFTSLVYLPSQTAPHYTSFIFLSIYLLYPHLYICISSPIHPYIRYIHPSLYPSTLPPSIHSYSLSYLNFLFSTTHPSIHPCSSFSSLIHPSVHPLSPLLSSITLSSLSTIHLSINLNSPLIQPLPPLSLSVHKPITPPSSSTLLSLHLFLEFIHLPTLMFHPSIFFSCSFAPSFSSIPVLYLHLSILSYPNAPSLHLCIILTSTSFLYLLSTFILSSSSPSTYSLHCFINLRTPSLHPSFHTIRHY